MSAPDRIQPRRTPLEDPVLTVVMPVFNEKATVEEIVGRVLAVPVRVELIAVDDHMRSMIHEGVSEQDLERHARTMGQSIRADGRRRVLEGSTTIEELLRVTRED